MSFGKKYTKVYYKCVSIIERYRENNNFHKYYAIYVIPAGNFPSIVVINRETEYLESILHKRNLTYRKIKDILEEKYGGLLEIDDS